MKNRNSKLFKAIMIGATAMLILCSHRVSAAEMNIYKQDNACTVKQSIESFTVANTPRK